jgi:hypothetical protein
MQLVNLIHPETEVQWDAVHTRTPDATMPIDKQAVTMLIDA